MISKSKSVPCWHLYLVTHPAQDKELVATFTDQELAESTLYGMLENLIGDNMMHLEDGVIYVREDENS